MEKASSWIKRGIPIWIVVAITIVTAICSCLLGTLMGIPSESKKATMVAEVLKQTASVGLISTYTPSNTPTLSFTPTFTFTPTLTFTPTFTFTPSITPTPTITYTPTLTFTPTATLPSSIAACIPRETKREVGIVVNIVDGDTIDVVISGTQYRVRYIGLDTPEVSEYYFSQAKAANTNLVYDKRVLLVKDVSETDKYDRLLRYVIVGDTFVNQELVRKGFAHATAYPPDVACSSYLVMNETQARLELAGFWKPTPTASIGVIPIPLPTSSGGGGNCDPAYPTVCIPPPPPDLDCGDISFRNFQVLPPDPHNFDGDGDGIGCEGN